MRFGLKAEKRHFLVLILLLALLLRLYGLGGRAFGVDEFYETALVSKSLGDVIYNAVAVNPFSPPLYDLLAFALNWIGGRLAIQLFSVVCGVLGVYAGYRLASKLFGEKTGVLTALLLSLNPFHLFYSQHMRSISLVALEFTVFLYLLLLFLEKQDRKNSVLLGLVAALFLYTHYVAGIVLATAFIFLLWKQKNKQIQLRELVTPFVIAGVLFLPQAFILLSHPGLANRASYEVGIKELPYAFYKLSAGANISFLFSINPLLLLAPLLACSLFFFGLWKMQGKKKLFELFAVNFFLPFPFIAIASLWVDHFLWPRNFAFLLPLYCIAISFGLREVKSKGLALALLAGMLIGWIAIIALYFSVVTMPDWNVFIGL